MGLIANMATKKGERAGAKLPVPTTAGDDQVIAAKTGEYFLPPEVVQAIGVDKLDALVESITGRKPGGEPAEMPEGAMHELMEGEMEGHANGGMVSKFDGVQLDPFADQSLRKYSFDGNGSALDDSVSRQVSRASKGMMASDEAWDTGLNLLAQRKEAEQAEKQKKKLGLAELSDMGVLGFANGGLISRMQGYAEGGIVDDLYGETHAKRAQLRNYNPQSTISPNATTNASPRAPELRNFTPEPGRLQPGSVGPRISGLAAQPPAGTPSATVRALDARVPGDASAVEAQRAKAAAQAGKLTGQAQSAAATAAAPPKQGLISRVAQKVTPSRATVAGGLAGAGMVGAGQAIADMGTGYRDEFNRSLGAESPLATTAADTVRTLAEVGDAATFGLAGRVGRGIASATGGGSFGEGFASPSDRDRFLASKPQQVAAAPQMTDRENQDEIARRRAALEGPQVAQPAAVPTQAIAAAPQPKRGPVSGLAARAAKPASAAPSQPAAPSSDPAVMADAQAAQAELDQSPIARVVGGTGGAMTIQYKDGTTKQVGQEGMSEVNGFYGLTSRAARQYDAQPVEVIAGNAGRSQAMPELGYQQVPDAIARSGKATDYVTGLAQGALDRADPVAAELRARLAEIGAQGDNSIRVSNATDRDGEGRGLRNQLTRMELGERQQIADLRKRAMSGDQAAIQQLGALGRSGGGGQDEYIATSREVPLDPSNPMLGTVKEPVIFNKRTGLPVQGGAVQSGPSYEQYAAQIRAKNPGASVTDAQLQAAYKKQFQQGQ